jgi:tubulin---tyrosine ligase
MVMTATNGIIKGYWFKEGYIRTSSREFNVYDLEDKMIHLTNDAV